MSYRMTARERILAYVVGGTAALIVNVVLLRYLLVTHEQLQRDRTRQEGQLQGMRNLLAHTELWQQREAWLRERQPALENEARAGSDLLTQVQELARQKSVTVEQPAIANPERHPDYTAITISLETKSTWKALVQFLTALQGPEQFIVLESANLKIDPQDQTQMRGRFRIAKWFSPARK